MRFHATHIEADPDDGDHNALLFLGELNAGAYLLLGRGSDSEDTRVYLEVSEQSYSGYDQLLACVLHPNRLEARWRPEFPAPPGTGEGTSVLLPEPCPEMPSIRATLQHIFRGRSEFTDLSLSPSDTQNL